MAVKRSSLWVAAAAVVLGASVALVWQVRVNWRQAARMAQLSAENRVLRKRADILALQAVPVVAPPAAEPPAAQGRSAPRQPKPGENPEDLIAIQRLELSLADANASIARLQSRLDEAEAKIQDLAVDNKRLAASEADLTPSLATANQTVDVLQKELTGLRDHSTQIEIAYQKLRDQTGTDAQKLAQLQQLAAEMLEIQQRRETYLNSIVRRYKQITEQYRSLAGVLQDQRTGTPEAGSTEMARIQDAISLAEEDLRQLSNLDAQALRIQKKMAGK
jgi:small-conductance mechanosensitive channel